MQFSEEEEKKGLALGFKTNPKNVQMIDMYSDNLLYIIEKPSEIKTEKKQKIIYVQKITELTNPIKLEFVKELRKKDLEYF